jgi:pimeloyl-ACP methyl ester carboxylesterase
MMLPHGFPGTAWSWRYVAPVLAERGWRVVAPFSRGGAMLRAAQLLRGARNLPVADLDRFVAVVQDIADLAVSLGDDLESLGSTRTYSVAVVKPLDGLVTWSTIEHGVHPEPQLAW